MSEARLRERGGTARLSAYQRWEMGTLDCPPAEARRPARGPTVDELENLHRQAREEGFRAGREEGLAQARAECARLAGIVRACAEEAARIEEKLAEDVLSLALELARQMVREALRVKPGLVLAVVRDALAALGDPGQRLSLRVHPADAALLREQLGDRELVLVEDPSIEPGGCLLEAGSGEVDATLATRWSRIVAALGRHGEWLQP